MTGPQAQTQLRQSPPRGAGPGKPKAAGPNIPLRRTLITFLVLLALNYLLVRTFFTDPDAPITIPYTAFKQEVTKKNVQAVYARGESIEGRFAKALTWPPPKQKAEPGSTEPRTAKTFQTTLPAFVD